MAGILHGLGIAPSQSALWSGGSAAPGGAGLWLDASGNTTIVNNLTVSGVTAFVGGTTMTGLFTLTSSTGGAAQGSLAAGTEELLIQNTQAATAGNTIRGPGYIDFEGQAWNSNGTTSISTGKLGRLGVTCGGPDPDGIVSTYDLTWANTAGSTVWKCSQAGTTVQSGNVQAVGLYLAGGYSGTAASPAFSWIDDQDTGIYRIGANTMGFSCGNSLRFTLDATNSTFAGGLVVAGGSAAGPGLAYSGAPSTGVYRSVINANEGVGITGGGKEICTFSQEGTTGGWMNLLETDANAVAADLTANTRVAMYLKNDNLCFAFNDGVNVRYLFIPLTGTGTGWSHDTTGP